MFEFFITILLLHPIPDAVFGIAAATGTTTIITSIDEEMKQKRERYNTCDILTKNYANSTPEWVWGSQKEKFNFHEFIGLKSEIIKELIPDLTTTSYDERSSTDYTLNIYFKNNCCVQIEYVRPLEPDFLSSRYKCLVNNFHTKSEFLPNYLIDMKQNNHDFIYGLLGLPRQSVITATLCPESADNGLTFECTSHLPNYSQEGYKEPIY